MGRIADCDPGSDAQRDAQSGLGVGPTAVALVTDYVFGDDMAIRYSLFIVASVATSATLVLITLEQWGARQPAESS